MEELMRAIDKLREVRMIYLNKGTQLRTEDVEVISQLLNNRHLSSFSLSLEDNKIISTQGLNNIFRLVAAWNNLTFLELNLNGTKV